jgi:hypothetical protein
MFMVSEAELKPLLIKAPDAFKIYLFASHPLNALLISLNPPFSSARHESHSRG